MVAGNNTFLTSRSNQVDRMIARRGVSLSREEWEGGLLVSFARATRGLGRIGRAASAVPLKRDIGEDLPGFTVT